MKGKSVDEIPDAIEKVGITAATRKTIGKLLQQTLHIV